MPSTIIFDRTDPQVDKMVAGWKDGGTYPLEIMVRQLKSGDNQTVCSVLEVSAGDVAEDDMAAPMPTSKPKPKSMPSSNYAAPVED